MLTFEPIAHEYRFAGKVVPGVTSILAKVMNLDAMPTDLLERGRMRGSAIHAITQAYDDGTLENWMVPLTLEPYLQAYRSFHADVTPKWEAIEEIVYHKIHGYAGCLDRRGLLFYSEPVQGISPEPIHAIVDIKTGDWHDSYGPQLSAYYEAQLNGICRSEPNRYTLHLRNDGTYKLRKCITKHREDFALFLALLICYRWREKHGC